MDNLYDKSDPELATLALELMGYTVERQTYKSEYANSEVVDWFKDWIIDDNLKSDTHTGYVMNLENWNPAVKSIQAARLKKKLVSLGCKINTTEHNDTGYFIEITWDDTEILAQESCSNDTDINKTITIATIKAARALKEIKRQK